MKAPARVLEVESTLTGEHITMSIDPRDFAHIASVLTDLYSDPIMAVIREYSTNARDGHRVTGQTRPIEVSLPNPLSSYFKVRDFGCGLDGEDMRTILSKYGSSTKRNDNTAVGMLGLGSKAAMTYTNQFTMTGIKDTDFYSFWDDEDECDKVLPEYACKPADGREYVYVETKRIMTQVSYERQPDGVPAITILFEGETDEPCGVEVIVPTKRDTHLWEEKADEFFQYWQPGTVLVNGKAPRRIDGVWIADDLLLTTEIEQSVVVMGDVPYPILEDVSIDAGGRNRWDNVRGRYNTTHVVAFVNIGDVHFTPSRESLQATSETKATLHRIRDRVKNEKNPAFERIIASAPSKQEALKMYHEVVEVGYTADTPKWNGRLIPLKWELPDIPALDDQGNQEKDWRGNPVIHSQSFMTAPGVKYRGRKGTGSDKTIQNDPTAYVWIVNFDGAEMTPYKRLKLDQYVERECKFEAPDAYVLVQDLPTFDQPDGSKDSVSDWFTADRILDWSVIDQEKIVREKTKTQSGRPSGSYIGYVNGKEERSILAEKIDTNKPIFWEHGSTGYWSVIDSRSISTVRELHKDATIIVLGGNRIAKFQRDFPMAKQTMAYLRETAREWAENLTDDEKLHLHFNDEQGMRTHLRSLNSIKDTLDDPELVKAIDLAMTNCPTPLLNKWKLLKMWGASYTASFKNPLDRYNLLTHMRSYATLRGRSADHLHLYLNAAYAADSAAKTAEQEAAV